MKQPHDEHPLTHSLIPTEEDITENLVNTARTNPGRLPTTILEIWFARYMARRIGQYREQLKTMVEDLTRKRPK